MEGIIRKFIVLYGEVARRITFLEISKQQVASSLTIATTVNNQSTTSTDVITMRKCVI